MALSVTEPLTLLRPAAVVSVAAPTLAAEPCTFVTVRVELLPVSGSMSLERTPGAAREMGMLPLAA